MTNPNDCNFLDKILGPLRLLASEFVGHNEDDLMIFVTWEFDTVGEFSPIWNHSIPFS